MKCPECVRLGLTSNVYFAGYARTTLMGINRFYDEEGKLHEHNGNKRRQDYTCSNHHKFEAETSKSCWCGWGKKEVVFKMKTFGDQGTINVG